MGYGNSKDPEELVSITPVAGDAHAPRVAQAQSQDARSAKAQDAQAQDAHAQDAQAQDVNYSDREDLWRVLREKKVQLVLPTLFLEEKAPLPKCQDVPRKYVLDVDALTDDQWENLVIIAISYCWIDKDHPDPDGYHFATLRQLFMRFRAGKFDEAERDKAYDMDGKDPPAWWLQSNGFCLGSGDGRPVGVFLDWLSVPQDKPAGSRTPEQDLVFKSALKNINLWYAHAHTITWMLTSLPPTVARPSYDDSGWTTFERCVGGILSPQSNLLCIDNSIRDKLLGDWDADYLQVSLDTMDRQRGAPLAPSPFNALIQNKTFTNNADMDTIVIPKYESTFLAVIANAVELKYTVLGFGDQEARDILAVIRGHCVGNRKRLHLDVNQISVPLEEWAPVCEELELQVLDLGMNPTLGGDLGSLQQLHKLTTLLLSNTAVGGYLGSLQQLTNLTVLDLSHSAVGGDLGSLQQLHNLTVLALQKTAVGGDLGSLQQLTNLTELGLSQSAVGGDLRSLQELHNLTELFLFKTQVTAPDGCPRDGDGGLWYEDAAPCSEVLAWLKAH